jgi:16S rRNA (guanine966-N2)-methyltransferase
MRVTGGSARGRRLKSPPPSVRPTSDRVREAIFDVLEARGFDMTRVLDLYAGSGAVGIEALSRGAGECHFVERERSCCDLIRENLALAGLTEHGRVYCMAVERAVDRLTGPYTLVLADPPYAEERALTVLERIASSLVGPQGAVVLEHSARREAPASLGPLEQAWSRAYGDSAVAIYQAKGAV